MKGRPGADADVLIVGGGLAGCSLALMLGRAGLAVELHEQHQFPRDKPCGEGLMPVGCAVLARWGLSPLLTGAPFKGIRYFGFGRELDAVFPGSAEVPAQGSAERRLVLDANLFAAARDTPGVVAHQGTRVEGPVMEGGRVVGIEVGGAIRRAPLVVAADGPRSIMRRRMDLDPRPPRQARLGVRGHFRLAADNPAAQAPRDHVQIFVGDGHEIYVTPLPGQEISVGLLGSRQSFAGEVKSHFAQACAGHPRLAALLNGAQPSSDLAGRTPLATRARRGWVPGLVLLGDAAIAIDPITGAGMSHALLSAELLAASIARQGTLAASDDVIMEFDRRRTILYREAVILSHLVLSLVRRPQVARGAFGVMKRLPGLFGHLVGVAGGTRPLLPL